MNIYVSNIPYQTTEEEMNQAFAAFGTVASARIIKDKMTGRSRGFGFVEMENETEARAALEGMNGAELSGRKVNAREARPREEGRPGGNGDQGGQGGNGGNGGGYQGGGNGNRNHGGGNGGGYRDNRPNTSQSTNRGVY